MHDASLSRKQRQSGARHKRARTLMGTGTQRAGNAPGSQLRSRRLRILLGVAAVAFLAALIAALSIGGASSSSPGPGEARGSVSDAQLVASELAGIPQSDMALGSPLAPVTIHEYGDLQCTACSAFASGTLPAVIDRLVKPGKARIVFHNWPIIDRTDSVAAAAATYAAGRQGRAWQFIELFYRNQGAERSGYVTARFLGGLAAASGLSLATFNADRGSSWAAQRLRQDTREALVYGFKGTPSFRVSGPHGSRIVEAALGDAQPFVDAVREVGGA